MPRVSSQNICLILLVVLALGLRVLELGESLWFDEIWSTRTYLTDRSFVRHLVLTETWPPLFFPFMYVWTGVFGNSELSVRLPFLFFGLASLPLTYLLARRILCPSTALLATFLLIISPVHIRYSQEARPYTAILFFLLLAIYTFDKLVSGDKRLSILVTFLVAQALMLLTHYFCLLFSVLFLAIGTLKCNRGRLRVVLGTIVLILTIGIWMLYQRHAGHFALGKWYLRPFGFFEWWMLFFNWFGLANSPLPIHPYEVLPLGWKVFSQHPHLLVLHLAILAFFILGLFAVLRSRNGRGFQILLPLFSLPLALLLLTYLGYDAMYIERGAFMVLPCFAMVLAHGVTVTRIRSLQWGLVVLLSFIQLLPLGFSLMNGNEWTVYKPRPDWRSAIRFLEAEPGVRQASALVVCGFSGLELKYYSGGRIGCIPVRDNRDLENMIHRAKEVKDVYLIHDTFWPLRFSRSLQRLKSSGFTEGDLRTFKALEIHKLTNHAHVFQQ